MGSVKDLQIIKTAGETSTGVGRFHFSDRYSVFDWGEMPDHIPNKGAALCIMSAFCFEQAEKLNVKTHYRGLTTKEGKNVRVAELTVPTDMMEVDLVRVVKPQYSNGNYDYSAYTPELNNFLIPLEVIYRNGLPQGSSFFKRLERGEIRYQDYGLEHAPKEGERLKSPIFDMSTKLEAKDRYISWEEAKRISALTPEEFKEIESVLTKINSLITQIAHKANLVNEDGKIELAYSPQRTLMVVDVIGTLDECRFTFDGFHVSKEVARQFYIGTPWHKHVEEAKQMAIQQKTTEWKKLCQSQPTKLEPALVEIISHLYTSTANAFLERTLFDSPPLSEVVERYTKWMKRAAQQ